MRKLFVVTAGTIAAGVGQEILRQMNARPYSDLKIMVRYIDTARLTNRYPNIHDGEWYQMNIDPTHMRATYRGRSKYPQLDKLLYDGLLPKPTGVGGGRIRYNGAGAIIMNREGMRKWLKSNITDLARSGSGQTNITVALIISSVGATGSGSLEHLADVIADSARDAGLTLPVRCDIFILQPGVEGVNNLSLANTLTLYAELAATRLAQSDIYEKRYQGRIILVGWGSKNRLSSIEQLEEAAATQVRLVNDPATAIVAEFQEREVDNHVLLQLDPMTLLPTNLSSATAVTIGLGHLEEQIIQRDAATLINNLVFGSITQEGKEELLTGTFATSMPGETPEDRYANLLQHISSAIEPRCLRGNFRNQVLSLLPQEYASKLQGFWNSDTREIAQRSAEIRSKGDQLVKEITANWLRLRRDGMVTSSTLSLSSLRGEYKRLSSLLKDILRVARGATGTSVDDSRVNARLRELDDAARRRGGLFGHGQAEQNTQRSADTAIREIQRNVRARLDQAANPFAIDVLEDMELVSSEALRNLEAVLLRLERQRQSSDIWAAASRPLSMGIDHPLNLAALSGKRKEGGKSEIESYYQRVSIFTSRSRKRSSDSTEIDQLAAFRKWLSDQQELDDLFKGEIDLLLSIAQDYTRKQVHEEVEKYSVLDVLLQDGEETLQQRLREAAALANPFININNGFAKDRDEIWHVCAYCRNKDQRNSLDKAITQVFGQGRCSLLETKDPTEIVVFYYVDGIPMSAVEDLTGRCLDAFLELRQNWYRQTKPTSDGTTNNPTQHVGVPVYSGKDAEERVIKYDIICKLCTVMGRDITAFRDLPELKDCAKEELDHD